MIWYELAGALGGTGIIGGWVAHLLAKRKYNAETDGEVIKNFKEAITEWKELRETYKVEIEVNRVEIARLRDVIKRNQEECDETNRALLKRINILEKEMEADKKMVIELTERLKRFAA
jgi:gas vesicle protein